MRTTEKELIKEKGLKEYLRIRLVTLKYSLQRGWSWAQVPAFSTMGAGIMKPYFPNISIWTLGIISFIGIIIIGQIDRTFRILHAENKYKSSKDPILLEILRKVEKLDNNKKIKLRRKYGKEITTKKY